MLGGFSSHASQQYRHALNRPECAERSDGVSGQRLHPSRPANLQDAEGALQRKDQRDETELAELDADVEADERQRQFMPRQAGAGESAGEAEAMQQSEGERDDPGMANGEAGF